MNVIKSSKRALIGKANSMIFIAAIVGSVSLSIAVVTGKILIDRHKYQTRIVAAKKTARDNLRYNVGQLDKLKTNLVALDQTANNSQVVLEALPSKYDFPAVGSSIELIAEKSGQDKSTLRFTGKDQGDTPAKSSTKPTPFPMLFTAGVKGPTNKVNDFLKAMESSIRPIKFKTMTIKGDSGGVSLSVDAETYYQPSKDVSITTKEIK